MRAMSRRRSGSWAALALGCALGLSVAAPAAADAGAPVPEGRIAVPAASSVPAATTRAAAAQPSSDGWFTAWAQSQQRRSVNTFEEQTFRMITHLSQGGDSVRVRLQNQFGDEPVTVDAAAVALAAEGAATVEGTTRALEFDGDPSVTIAPGADVWSDPVALTTTAQDDVAVSMYLRGPAVPSLHEAPYRENYASPRGSGNEVGDTSGSPFTEPMPWTYLVSAVDVHNTGLHGTTVAYGSSVVDGEGSQDCGPGCTALGTDRRWTDELGRRINSELPPGAQIAVANAGIGGTTSSPACGPGENDGVSRLERDVLGLHGVTAVIYYYGTNDVADEACTAQDIIDSYRDNFQRMREAGIEVYVTPITPRPTYTAEQNRRRGIVNEFVRAGGDCSGECDGVIDFDAVLRDPNDPRLLLPQYNTGDGVHVNVAGQQALANAVPLPVIASSGLDDDAPAPELLVPGKYGFERGYQGWAVTDGRGTLRWVDDAQAAIDGRRSLSTRSFSLLGSQGHEIFVEPPAPLDLSRSGEFVVNLAVPEEVDAGPYEASIQLTNAAGTTHSGTFDVTGGGWSELRLDLTSWTEREAVTRIEIGLRAPERSMPWTSRFRIDEVSWPEMSGTSPRISTEDAPPATVGTEYSFVIRSSGDPAPTLHVTGGELPPGLLLDEDSGIVHGVPSEAGEWEFTVVAANGVPPSAEATLSLSVRPADTEDPGGEEPTPGGEDPGGEEPTPGGEDPGGEEPTRPGPPEEPTAGAGEPDPSEETDHGTAGASLDDAAGGQQPEAQLPRTGSDVGPALALAGSVLVLGAGLLLRRRRSRVSA